MLLRWQPCSSLCLQLARGGGSRAWFGMLWWRCVCGGFAVGHHHQALSSATEQGNRYRQLVSTTPTDIAYPHSQGLEMTAAHGQRWVMPGFQLHPIFTTGFGNY
jgi:hypothetical protein